MFPNNSLKSISPDVSMMQTFPNIFFLKEMVVGSSQEKETLRCVGIIQSHLTFWGCIPLPTFCSNCGQTPGSTIPILSLETAECVRHSAVNWHPSSAVIRFWSHVPR